VNKADKQIIEAFNTRCFLNHFNPCIKEKCMAWNGKDDCRLVKQEMKIDPGVLFILEKRLAAIEEALCPTGNSEKKK